MEHCLDAKMILEDFELLTSLHSHFLEPIWKFTLWKAGSDFVHRKGARGQLSCSKPPSPFVDATVYASYLHITCFDHLVPQDQHIPTPNKLQISGTNPWKFRLPGMFGQSWTGQCRLLQSDVYATCEQLLFNAL
jgi:hypothetical protein